MATLNLVEATIDELQAALSSGSLTSVELVAHYLRRISHYDCRGITLNSIPILNLQLFDDAAASDDRRASGLPVRRLEGIPYTVKDSYKVKGMTVASGSPAFKDLIATEDAFTVSAIRAEGGVLIGRTNMPPMAYGGMQRGIYGRAESPYNPDYLAAAFVSGSSNGSAVSTAASFAAFGMGEETVSSGRSPASNNALVAYTPSRGYISIRGNWPLYPTCDVVVPHTRTMDDMLVLLEVIAVEDASTQGDFWRDQPFVKLPKPWQRSLSDSSFGNIATCTSLKGVRFAVPAMYIGESTPQGATPVTTSEAVINLWKQAKDQLESLGAEVVIVPDFPAITAYEHPELIPEGSPRLPEDWNWTERGPLVAHGWDLFLRDNKDPNIFDLTCVHEFNIYPDHMRTPAELKHLPASNAIHWGKLASYVSQSSIYETKNLEVALNALEDMRKHLLDQYLELFNCDCFIFPAAGDVAASDADVDDVSAAHAWTNGIHYSNGNRALRHLGIPSVTVPLGIIPDKQMPMGLTFAGRAYDDTNLLKWANAFEKKTKIRVAPAYTPPLQTDHIELSQTDHAAKAKRPMLAVEECVGTQSNDPHLLRVDIKGIIQMNRPVDASSADVRPLLHITVDGEDVPPEQIRIDATTIDLPDQNVFRFEGWALTPKPVEKNEREKTMAPVVYDKNMVVILARSAPDGYPAGFLGLV
ncbi:amidase signature domain-containing protein [Dactylonectria macrodidyma]|uniref:Amidase signature domain-containing protein n=1 Tax=Dactylonectria macrodidyma TaxID=307937 RepID=A0A9P9EPZ5_9HYPO|nr:amidase signature domain-containing protein [Dactylonectria macrodidyma]